MVEVRDLQKHLTITASGSTLWGARVGLDGCSKVEARQQSGGLMRERERWTDLQCVRELVGAKI